MFTVTTMVNKKCIFILEKYCMYVRDAMHIAFKQFPPLK